MQLMAMESTVCNSLMLRVCFESILLLWPISPITSICNSRGVKPEPTTLELLLQPISPIASMCNECVGTLKPSAHIGSSPPRRNTLELENLNMTSQFSVQFLQVLKPTSLHSLKLKGVSGCLGSWLESKFFLNLLLQLPQWAMHVCRNQNPSAHVALCGGMPWNSRT